MPRRPDRSVTGGATVDAVGRGRALTTCGAGSPARRPAPTRCRMPGGSRASSDGRGERPGRPPRTAAGRGGGRAGNRRHLSAAGDRLGFSRGSVAVRRRDGREAPPLERSWPGAGLPPPGNRNRDTEHSRVVCGRGGRVEERRVAGRGRWLIRRFRNRAAGRVPWVRFLPPLSEPGGPISGTGLSSGIMRLAHGLPGHDQQTGLASPGTRLAPLRRPAGASSGLLTPWRRRPLGSSPSLVHVMTSGIPAHLRGDRPSATPVSLLPFAIAST